MLLLLLLAIVTALYYIPWLKKVIGTYARQYPYVKKLPGPKGLPFIGQLMDLDGDTTVPLKFWAAEAEKARLNGDSVFTLTLLGRVITFPMTGETMKAMCESTEELHKGRDYEFLKPWIGTGILLSVGKPMKDRRKMYASMFHFTMLEGYLETFNKHARVLTEILGENVGKVVNMAERSKRISLDVICDTAFEVNFDTQHDSTHPYLKAVHEYSLMQQRYEREPQMWVNWIWFLFYRRDHKEILNKLHALSDDILQARLVRLNKGEIDLEAKHMPLIDHYFSQLQKGLWTIDEVHYELNGAVFGGHDTTSSTLTWIFWALGTQPEFQQQCNEEIRDVIGDVDRDLTHQDMKDLVFLDRFIKEAMRIFPPIPAVTRELQSDFQMGKYLLPAGSEVLMSPHILHHNPDIYPDPWVFDPDRWLPENVAKRSPYDYVPWSAGQRNCLGQKFAMHEIKTILAWVLRKFSFSTDRKMLDQGFAIEVICKPTIPVELLVTARN